MRSGKQYRKATINIPQVSRIIGWLLWIEALFMLLPLATCFIYGESDWEGFAVAAAAAAVAGTALGFIKPRSRDMGKREGFLLTALVWVVFSAFGMIPFMMMSHHLSLSAAFFEAMSGFTTTGASVIDDVSTLSHGILIWRSEMNWIGGMGIILFTLAVIPMLNHSGGMQMFNAEVTGITHDKLRPRVSQTAKGLWMVYIVLTVVLTALLWLGPMNFFDSVCHGFSTVSTGGFSTRNNSIGAWHSVYIDCVITLFMFLGSVNFALLFKASHGDWKSVVNNDVFKTFLKLIALYYMIVTLVIILRHDNLTVAGVTIYPLFEILSAMSSTGYNIVGFNYWGTFVLSVTFIMMFFGACAGSTSGGAKIDRMLYLLKNLRNEIYRCVHSNSIRSVRVNGKMVNPDLLNKVIAFLCLYVIVIAVGGCILTALGQPLTNAFVSSFSCVSNIGISPDITGYNEGYASIPAIGQWALSLIMLTGRLEVFTILVLFSPGFWHK